MRARLDPALLLACATVFVHQDMYALDGDGAAIVRVVAREAAARLASPGYLTVEGRSEQADPLSLRHVEAIGAYARAHNLELVPLSAAILASGELIRWWCETLAAVES